MDDFLWVIGEGWEGGIITCILANIELQSDIIYKKGEDCMYTLSLSEISAKNVAELFSCHKKLAKTIVEKIEATPKDQIAYKKEILPDGKIKISVFLYKNGLLTIKLDYWFERNSKKVLQMHFYKVANGNVVIREDFSDGTNSYVNEYDVNGNVLVRMYSKGTVLEMYEYDDNGLIFRMNYYVNSKWHRIFLFTYDPHNDTYFVVETDTCGREKATHGNIPIEQYMRPRKLAFEIRE